MYVLTGPGALTVAVKSEVVGLFPVLRRVQAIKSVVQKQKKNPSVVFARIQTLIAVSAYLRIIHFMIQAMPSPEEQNLNVKTGTWQNLKYAHSVLIITAHVFVFYNICQFFFDRKCTMNLYSSFAPQ